MKTQLLILFTIITSFANAQMEESPQFPGGQDILDSFVKANFNFPNDLKPDEAEGKIVVEFWVDVDGTMDSIKVIHNTVNIGANRCDNEAVRVFVLVANNYVWEPGIKLNKKSKVKYHYPIMIKQGKVWERPKYEEPEPPVFMFVEHMPEFPGGHEALSKFIADNVRYPEAAIEAEEEGVVRVEFVVEPDGTMTGIKINKSNMSKLCNEEALRVVKRMAKKHKWKPGTQGGKAVRTKMVLPIKFTLM